MTTVIFLINATCTSRFQAWAVV